METLNFLAELWGFSFAAMGLSLLVNQKNVKKLLQFVESEVHLFYVGTLLFILGVASVLSYNVWSQSWGVIVTILGWLLVLKGIAMMFWPSMVKKMTDKIDDKKWLQYVFFVAVVIGLVIIYLGFKA